MVPMSNGVSKGVCLINKSRSSRSSLYIGRTSNNIKYLTLGIVLKVHSRHFVGRVFFPLEPASLFSKGNLIKSKVF
jgi:hypothetical protein